MRTERHGLPGPPMALWTRSALVLRSAPARVVSSGARTGPERS
jgi:hypothetical protein